MQQRICNVVWSTAGNILGAKNTGANPLAASISNTMMPGHLPSVRITFVAPILPLPTVRMSIPRALAQRNPVGIDPNKYETTAQPTQMAVVMRATLAETRQTHQ